MALSVIGADTVNTGVNKNAVFTVPGGLAANDLLVMVVTCHRGAYVPGTPSGWIAGPVVNVSGSMGSWLFWKWLAGSEGGSSQGWTGNQWETDTRKSIGWAVVRGVSKSTWDNSLSDSDRFASASDTNSESLNTPTKAVSNDLYGHLVFHAERGSPLSDPEDITVPSGYSHTTIYEVTGNGACRAIVAWDLDPEDTSVGSGTWGASGSTGVSLITVALPIALVAPTGLSVGAKDHESIQVSWTPVPGAFAGHEVQVDGGAPFAADSSSGHTFTGLDPETTYTFGVRGLSATQEGPFATVQGTTDSDPGSPGTPGVFGDSFADSLNRLAGTTGLSATEAANVWAGTSGLSLVDALNVKAGNSFANYQALGGVCNQLAGTANLSPADALTRVES